jgi:hypothetical protein
MDFVRKCRVLQIFEEVVDGDLLNLENFAEWKPFCPLAVNLASQVGNSDRDISRD